MIVGVLIGGVFTLLFFIPSAQEPSRSEDGTLPSISGGNVNVNAAVPSFVLPGLDGNLISSEQWSGKIILINFWATWCDPCLEELPVLDETYRAHPGEIIVLGIAVGENADEVKQFLSDKHITYPILLDEDRRVSVAFQIFGFPTTYFIDQGGIIRAKHVGVLSPRLMEQYLIPLGIHP